MKFTYEESKLLWAACMKYGNILTEMATKFSHETDISDLIIDRACQVFDLAKKITMVGEFESEVK